MDTYFVVTISADGTFDMHSELPKNLEKSHEITISEIYTVVKQIVQNVEAQMVADRVTNAVLSALAPQAEQTVPDKVKEKLKERGIKTDSSEETA
jgi:hypothetical protein